ncbi:hypothetical protein AtubIFM55763_010094 [Aspergillus tubingensis]|uniref:Uncharacterized protein n=2 Tax=Aspergillus tubingensis TaxID=5068 RepID=A0A9W6AXG2_ASPTU|nr:hypothetical protein AtubIFM55763_010094 [Aspergillus tubingensis]GLA89673.1 hypothetical protein AtubIFM56815_004161 [Aspergillus tubingensis]
MSNDYATQLALKLNQVQADMNSWRAERRGWEAAILAGNGMQPSILQGLSKQRKKRRRGLASQKTLLATSLNTLRNTLYSCTPSTIRTKKAPYERSCAPS